MIWMVDNDDTGGLVVVSSVIALLFVIQLIRQRRGSAALAHRPGCLTVFRPGRASAQHPNKADVSYSAIQ
jgi:hypothetical protein